MVDTPKTLAVICGTLLIAGGAVWLSTSRTPSQLPNPSPTSTSTGTSSTTVSTTTTITTTPPAQTQKGFVTGTVLLGPTCPVERMPPDPGCADKPYQTTIRIQPSNPSVPYTTTSSNASGAFSITLSPGTYTFSAGSASLLPRCQPVQVVVTDGQTKTVNIQCDTGIR